MFLETKPKDTEVILSLLSVRSQDSVAYFKAENAEACSFNGAFQGAGREGGREGGLVPKRRASLLNGLCRVNVPISVSGVIAVRGKPWRTPPCTSVQT